MEKEYRVSWLKVIGLLALIIAIIAIICLVYPNKTSKGSPSNTFVNNINLMKSAGFEYFKGNNLPDKIGSSTKITLDEMETSNLIVEFQDDKGNTCNKEESYVQVTKTLEDEYTMKVFLSCKEQSDYIITSIYENNGNSSNQNVVVPSNDTTNSTNNNSSNSTSNNTSKGATTSGTTGNYYTNSGSTKSTTNITYNINYVDNCKNCTGSNCGKCVNQVYYTVNFNSNGGSNVASQTVANGKSATYVESYRDGYTFLGWYLDGAKYNFASPVTEKITLLAKWEKNNSSTVTNKYTVTFNSNGGSGVSSQTIVAGYAASEPMNPTKSCYLFAGWYTDSSLQNRYNFNTAVNKNMTLYAKWVDDGSCHTNTYTISFNSNGGSSVTNQYVLEGYRATEPNNPTKSCYSFAGWYTDSSLQNRYYFNTSVTRNMTLYAKWVDSGSCYTKTYTVSFESNGGSYVANQYVLDGYRASEPSNPTKACYTFAGWYTNTGLTNRYYFSSAVTRNIKLYAKWNYDNSCNKYTVTFDSNGGSYVSSQSVNNGGYAYQPSNPTRSGYTFNGWYLNGSPYNFNSRVYNNITLTASWSKNYTSGRYSTYCKVKSKTYYSVSYVNADKTPTYSYEWTIRLDELTNAKNVRVTDNYNLYSYSSYEAAVNSKKQNLISMVGGNNGYSVPLNSAYQLQTYSLKPGNFTDWVSVAYQNGNYWYTDAHVTVKNYDNAVKYYASNIKSYIYTVPFAFVVKYTDLNDCVEDYTSNSSRYSDYEIINTYTR